MVARDLMKTAVVTVGEDCPLSEAKGLFVEHHVNGLPVVDRQGRLVGVVTQQDVYLGAATRSEVAGFGFEPRVRDVMTSPAIAVGEETEVADLCRLMSGLGVHRIPIVRNGRVAGIVSSIDVCRAVFEGSIAVPA